MSLAPSKTAAGRFFEDFRLGQTLRHATPRTLNAGDGSLYSALYGSRFAVQSAQATLNLAQRQLEGLKAQRKSAAANLAQSEAQRDQAKLNLSYTTVTAAQAGRVVNLGAAVGQFAQPGTSLTVFVPDDVWVTANFKEIQLDRMRPGEPVAIRVIRKLSSWASSINCGQRPSLRPPLA